MSLSKWVRPPRHVLTIFVGIMLVFGAALGWLGWQLLEQDRSLERQRVQERLEQAADRIVAELQLHNAGVAWRDGRFADEGAGRGDFKTPTLREVTRTAPYMHDGSLGTLEAVIAYYDRGGNRNPALDPELRPLHLSAAEKQDLAAFLRCLNGRI
jgi:cytochrome c peroxidase